MTKFILHLAVYAAVAGSAARAVSAQRPATTAEQQELERAAVSVLVADYSSTIPRQAVFDPRMYDDSSRVPPGHTVAHTTRLASALNARLLHDSEICRPRRPRACRLDGAKVLLAFRHAEVRGDTATVTLGFWQKTPRSRPQGEVRENGIVMTMLHTGNEWHMVGKPMWFVI